MKNQWFLVLCLLGANSCVFGQGQPAAGDVRERMRQVEQNLVGTVRIAGEGPWSLEQRMAEYKVQGLSMAVVKDFKIDWAKGYGWADVGEHRPVTTETVFQAASISKSINAIGVLKLVQEGKLDLNADINTILQSWKFPYDDVARDKKISMLNLLTHTAGLTVHGFEGYEPGKPLPTLTDILDGKQPANSAAVRSFMEPDVRPEYSGGGTTISQLVVSDVTHQPYDVYMRTAVLQPLGMTHSFFTQPPPADKRTVLAKAYNRDGTELKGKYRIHPEQAAAGLWTNPTDLAKYIIDTQLSLQGKPSKVLSSEYTKKRLTPYRQNVALGAFMEQWGSTSYFVHSGANYGFRCVYMGSMDGGYGVVIMVNAEDDTILREIVNSVAAVYQWPGFTPVPAKKIVKLTPAQWRSLDGTYVLQGNKNMKLQMTTGHEQLTLRQLWDGREVVFDAESDVDFFCKLFPFPLKFTRNAEGKPTQVLAFDRDVWLRDE